MKRKVRWARVIAIGIVVSICVFAALHKHYEPIDCSLPTEQKKETKEIVEEPIDIEIIYDYPTYSSIGTWRISYYCSCEKCNGKGREGVDCKGNPLVAGTIACNDLPYGTEVWMSLDGIWQKYVVRDRMASRFTGKNCIDVYITGDHHTCNELGIDYVEVFTEDK